MHSPTLARNFPWLLTAAVAGVFFVGWQAIARGDELAQGHLADRQLVWLVVSLPIMASSVAIPYRKWRFIAYPWFFLTLVLLVAVFAFPPRNGARRWIPLGVADLQPSEFMKLAFILSMARFLEFRASQRRWWGLVIPFAMAFIPMLLILKEPDLGTALVFLPILYAMLFAAGARPRHLAAVALMGIIALPVVWSAMSTEQQSRITALFTQCDGGEAPAGDGHHLHHSKLVLSSGGAWGSELAGSRHSDRQLNRLFASRTDFVFCLVGEQYGAWGACGVLALWLLLLFAGLRVAASTRDPFGRLVAVGIVVLLGTQVIINTGMTCGVMPITGLTLPFMSYGGSSLLSSFIAVGLLINVSCRPGYLLANEPFQFVAKS
jgi:cell division protein FtsW (lipid II flippase)